jgi:hypothetical protein
LLDPNSPQATLDLERAWFSRAAAQGKFANYLTPTNRKKFMKVRLRPCCEECERTRGTFTLPTGTSDSEPNAITRQKGFGRGLRYRKRLRYVGR